MTFPNLEDGENVVVLWADVAVTTERGHGDSVGVQHWQVVAVPTVCMFYKVISSRNFKSVDI